MDEAYDVVVVGGGAAGLSAGVVLARSRRRVLVVDAGEPRNAPAGHVHMVLGSEGAAPRDLLAAGREAVALYGGAVLSGRVVSAKPSGGAGDGPGFVVSLDDGRTLQARRLVLATGLVDELPDVPGVAELWGTDVLHCPYCHGFEVRDQAIGVLGTGPLAVHGALHWRQWSSDVVLFLTPSAPEPTEEQSAQLAARGVRVVHGEVAALETAAGRLSGVRLRSGEVVARQALVVAPRFAARAELLADLGLDVEEREAGGAVVGASVSADPMGATAVPGVWVAGNATNLMATVSVSAAAGTMVGAAVNGDLVAEDVRRAVARAAS